MGDITRISVALIMSATAGIFIFLWYDWKLLIIFFLFTAITMNLSNMGKK